MTNQERAQTLAHQFQEALFTTDPRPGAWVEILEAALDEAEKRGWHDGWAIAEETVERNTEHAVARLNEILDKVIEMDTCGPVEDSVCDPWEHGCNGTGLGPIARMVKEARE